MTSCNFHRLRCAMDVIARSKATESAPPLIASNNLCPDVTSQWCASPSTMALTKGCLGGMIVCVLAMPIMIALSTPPVSFTLAASFGVQNILLVGGAILVTVWALMLTRSKTRNSRSVASPRELIERNRQISGMQGQLQELMVEVEAMARRFGVQLDAKARRLENLLSQADDRIEELRELQGQPPRQTSEITQGEPQSESSPAQDQSQQPAPPPPIAEDPLAKSVYQLADSGMDAHAIAMELDEHVGKVELIMALRKVR